MINFAEEPMGTKITFKRPDGKEAAGYLANAARGNAPGVVVIDDHAHSQYPLAIDAAGRDEVFVGRVRQDASHPNGLAFWIVSDNVRKGAALNAVQIAEVLVNGAR